MKIAEIYSGRRPVISCEFFLPKTPADDLQFRASVLELKALGSSFMTLTYGAGGSARERTLDLAAAMKNELKVETAAHLTCIAHTRAEVAAILGRIKHSGIENIVALRGDVPKDGSALPEDRRELPHAVDLVREIRRLDGFSIAVAGYPEKHPEAPSFEEDLKRLAEKVAAGADAVITQLFFINADYFAFVSRARAAGIRVPIIPGIMPVTGYQQIKRFTQLCGAVLPSEMTAGLEPIQDDKEAVIAWGIQYAEKQCRELLEKGAPGLHFYTLNRTHSTAEVLRRLKV